MNLAVRTHKRWTFEMLNHHETHVALDAAQGCPHFKKRRKKQAITMASMKSRLRPAQWPKLHMLAEPLCVNLKEPNLHE
jgi:hypothetical protein